MYLLSFWPYIPSALSTGAGDEGSIGPVDALKPNIVSQACLRPLDQPPTRKTILPI